MVTTGNSFLTKKRNHIISNPIKLSPVLAELPWTPKDPTGQRHLLFVGQVAFHKGVDLLLDAFDMLAKTHDNLILNIVGGCDDRHLMVRLTNNSPGNGCHVKWWGYQEDVSVFLRDAYLLVQPSPPSRSHESFGIGVVEAMAFGVPSICFRSGALQEIVVQEETGLICEEEQALSLAACIDRLLTNVGRRNQYGREALRRYLEHYSASRIKAAWRTALALGQ